MDEQERRAEWRRRKLRRERRKKICIIAFSMVVIVGVAAAVIVSLNGGKGGKSSTGNKKGNVQVSDNTNNNVGESQPPETAPPADARASAIALANRTAAMYDYDKAIEMVKAMDGYDSDSELQQLVTGYETKKGELVPWTDMASVTHIFFHSLIKDTGKAFGDTVAANEKDGYNEYMTTIDEFNKIIQSMYDKGYVIISLHDLVKETTDENGNKVFVQNDSLMLPPGKRPFILSQDDVCFYHYMDGDGFATKLVLDENRRPTVEYKEDDGTVTTGNYEMVPLIEAFIDEHPDFSYRGRKGILALTGYDGVLGYRTDPEYKDINSPHLVDDQVQFLKNNPNFNWDEEVAKAKDVAQGLKDSGWEFASHTWGHIHCDTSAMDKLAADTQKWEERVVPIIGETDILIFPHGADFGDWHQYSSDNERFNFFKQHGFNYFCNVDGAKYFVQIFGNYVRTGRRNVDGYRMYDAIVHPEREWFTDLFDVQQVFDKARPVPVPGVV